MLRSDDSGVTWVPQTVRMCCFFVFSIDFAPVRVWLRFLQIQNINWYSLDTYKFGLAGSNIRIIAVGAGGCAFAAADVALIHSVRSVPFTEIIQSATTAD